MREKNGGWLSFFGGKDGFRLCRGERGVLVRFALCCVECARPGLWFVLGLEVECGGDHGSRVRGFFDEMRPPALMGGALYGEKKAARPTLGRCSLRIVAVEIIGAAVDVLWEYSDLVLFERGGNLVTGAVGVMRRFARVLCVIVSSLSNGFVAI